MLIKRIKYYINNTFNIINGHFVTTLIMISLLASYYIFNISTPDILYTGASKLKHKWINSGGAVGDLRPMFLRNNLIIDWDFYGSLSTNKIINIKKAYFGGKLGGPIFVTDNEKKPYYLFNLDINYVGYPLKLFRNFTKGDGTVDFIDNNEEIIAVLFYKSDFNKLMNIKRNIKNVVWDNKCLKRFAKCKIMGIMYLE